jgi:hypothetical protein
VPRAPGFRRPLRATRGLVTRSVKQSQHERSAVRQAFARPVDAHLVALPLGADATRAGYLPSAFGAG